MDARQSTKVTTPKTRTAFFLLRLNSSSRNAMAGCASEIDEVIPARKSSRNQNSPKRFPPAEPPDGPLDPHQRYAEQKERHDTKDNCLPTPKSRRLPLR